ncbi:MAG TPA: hypothetical protein VF265_09935, partial [Nevskiaceae bacterium]
IRAFMTEARNVNAALESLCATSLADLPPTSSDDERCAHIEPILERVRIANRAAGFDLVTLSRPVLRVEQIDQRCQRMRRQRN